MIHLIYLIYLMNESQVINKVELDYTDLINQTIQILKKLNKAIQS